jgi:hypothetical protein
LDNADEQGGEENVCNGWKSVISHLTAACAY